MSLRKLASLSLMLGLLTLGFAVLAGCDDNEVQEAHLPPNIGTDPTTGGQPAIVTLTGAFAGAVGGGGNGAPQTFTTKKGNVLPLTCPPDVVNCGTNAASSPFSCQDEAQAYFVALAQATGKADCMNLDGGVGNGLACDGIGLPQSCP